MALTLEKLIAPVDDDNPVGQDLSYSNERQQIEQAFEAEAGEDDERDWREIMRLIEAEAEQTKDIWLPVYVCRAGALAGSLETVAMGAQALAGLLEQYWDTVQPQLEELGLMGRKAPCDSLAARGGFLLPLERTVLVAHPRLGAFTGEDIQRFAKEREAADNYGMFRALLEDRGDEVLQEAIGQIDQIEDGLRRADRVFTDAAAGEPSPNYAPAYSTLSALRQSLGQFLSTPMEGTAEEAGYDEGAGGAQASAGQRISGRVENRDDVMRTLDLIADYYRRAEPSHPILPLLERVREWVPMDFLDLMKQIAPTGMDQVRELLSRREDY